MMTTEIKPFSFDTVGSMLVEWSAAKRLGEILGERFSERKILIVTDKGLHKAGVLDHALASLEKPVSASAFSMMWWPIHRNPCC